MQWRPTLGAWFDGQQTRFRVWASPAQRMELVLLDHSGVERVHPMHQTNDGLFSIDCGDAGSGTLYQFRVDGQGPFPDPASRFQPRGVHGPSEVIDPRPFGWNDGGWRGLSFDELSIYELHVGTFSPQGTYEGVIERLEWLAELGVTAIELMPVAEFAGRRNWGYDGVSLFASSHRYGRPDDLRRLVDRAHQLGVGVILDVVYNHLGPDGNYLPKFSSRYFSKRHKTIWGSGLNFDGPQSERVREFLIENALYWIHDFHIDGLRLDATHAILDDSSRHFLAELSGRVRETTIDRPVLLIAEDHRNLTRMVLPEDDDGWGLDGVWADDFHHHLRRRLAGDDESYFEDFSGETEAIAETIRRGWYYCGQHSPHFDAARGSDPSGVPLSRFVHCIQNHDQIGNRAFGDRLHHQIDPAAYRAASALLLTSPCTPLLFMGQEWGTTSPFQYFTDHAPELGKKVTRGRRREFQKFSAFTDPRQRRQIPDPQAESTFLDSRLNWKELEQPEHAALVRLYRRLLMWRRSALAPIRRGCISTSQTPTADDEWLVTALSESVVGLRYPGQRDSLQLVIVHLPPAGRSDTESRREPVEMEPVETASLLGNRRGIAWELVLSTEEESFSSDPMPPVVDHSSPAPTVHFSCPAAVILQGVHR